MKYFVRFFSVMLMLTFVGTSVAQQQSLGQEQLLIQFDHISEYQKLKEIPEPENKVDLNLQVPENEELLFKEDEQNKLSTSCIFHNFAYQPGYYLYNSQGMSISPGLYYPYYYYRWQWQPTTFTFSQPAVSVTMNVYDYGGYYYYGARMYVYDTDGYYIGQVSSYHWGWGDMTFNAPAGKKIGHVVVQHKHYAYYNFYTRYMYVCYETNQPPVAVATDVTVSADADCLGTASVEDIDNGSYDPDGDALSVSVSPEGPYALGSTNVVLTVSDGEYSSSASAVVTVVDDTSPVLVATSEPMKLWPPNHSYATINVEDGVAGVSDNCADLSSADVYITRVTSDEAENSNNNGDGNTTDDIVIADDCKSVDLRKERSGRKNGRVYTIYMAVDDGNGNVGESSFQVYVPKNNNSMAIDDGVAYEVIGSCGAKSGILADSKIDKDLYSAEMLVYPNPFSDRAHVNVTFENDGYASLDVYNLMGVKVATIYSGNVVADRAYKLELDASSLANGIYFFRLQNNNQVYDLQKVVLTR